MDSGANREEAPPQDETAAEQAADDAAEDIASEFVTDREAELAAEAAELKDKLLRAMAETDNLRKRFEKEKQDASRYAVTNFAKDILTVADNMSRAISSIPEKILKDKDSSGLVQGLKMTEKEVLSVFERHGIKKIDPLGEKFDSNFHQAMMEIETTDHPAGVVAQVLMPGFTIHDRLLRPAMVGVAKASAAAPVNTEEDQEPESE